MSSSDYTVLFRELSHDKTRFNDTECVVTSSNSMDALEIAEKLSGITNAPVKVVTPGIMKTSDLPSNSAVKS